MSWASCSLGHTHWGRRGAAGLLLAAEGKVLIQLRARWAHQGGTWSIPGGAIESRETPVAAALRESSEELGLDVATVAVAGSRVAECGGWTYETVLARPSGEISEVSVRDRAESDGHAWVPWAEVSARRLHPAFRLAWEHEDDVLRAFVAAGDRRHG